MDGRQQWVARKGKSILETTLLHRLILPASWLACKFSSILHGQAWLLFPKSANITSKGPSLLRWPQGSGSSALVSHPLALASAPSKTDPIDEARRQEPQALLQAVPWPGLTSLFLSIAEAGRQAQGTSRSQCPWGSSSPLGCLSPSCGCLAPMSTPTQPNL